MIANTCSLTVVAVVLFATLAHANETTSLGVGTTVFLTMTGELAEKYSQQVGALPKNRKPPSGLAVSTSARIVQKLKDGQFRLESVSRPIERSKQTLLITLSVTVKRGAITKSQTRAGTQVYSSPRVQHAVTTTKPITSYRIQLSNLKGVRLRTWKLQSELGE